MNRLRPHFADQMAQKPQRRLQNAIVADYRDDIIGLIVVDGATLTEVAAAVRAEGEPVLEAGFKAAILEQIGTVKNIRAGRIKAAAQNVNRDPSATSGLSPLPTERSGHATLDDDDEDFAARRPRS